MIKTNKQASKQTNKQIINKLFDTIKTAIELMKIF